MKINGWNIIPWRFGEKIIFVSKWVICRFPENKLLLISINFTPKTSHSCLEKWYTRFSRFHVNLPGCISNRSSIVYVHDPSDPHLPRNAQGHLAVSHSWSTTTVGFPQPGVRVNKLKISPWKRREELQIHQFFRVFMSMS